MALWGNLASGIGALGDWGYGKVSEGEMEVRRKRRSRWRDAVESIGGVSRYVAKWLDHPVASATALAAVVVVTLAVLSRSYDDWNGIWQGVFVEGAGATMDLALFGILIAVVAGRRERNREIKAQEELIDDLKKWNSEEARHRIAGAVRRLNRSGRTAIDFTGIEMSDFSFRGRDIESIAESKFYDGTWGSLGSRERMILEDVDFSRVDCREVVFSAFNPLGGLGMGYRHARLCDCRFVDARLEGAIFKGARMEWSEEPPSETHEMVRTRGGEEALLQAYFAPFDSADLAGASFEDVEFVNADFRGAENLDRCEFAGATGLESCLFDSDEDKERALVAAKRADDR